MKMPTYFTKKYQNCDKSKLSDLFTIDGTWIYTFEPYLRVNNKQLLCKDQARHVIVKDHKARENL